MDDRAKEAEATTKLAMGSSSPFSAQGGATNYFENLFIKEDSCATQYLLSHFKVEIPIVVALITLCLHQI